MGISLVPAGDKGETIIPWEFGNLSSPLQGHIGDQLSLKGSGLSIFGEIPREFLFLWCVQWGLQTNARTCFLGEKVIMYVY